MSTESRTLACEVETMGDLHFVKLNGSLSDEGIALARKAILDALNGGAAKIAVGMQDVGYVSSSGIGMLVSMLKRCHQHNVPLAICSLNTDIRELFTLTRLDQVFTIARDVHAWQKSLS
ncbi:MAG: STAS domain-containing protein [Planctomycetota bacterium]